MTAGSSATQSGLHGASQSAADLYEYDFDPASDTGRLVDMTVPAKAGEAAGVVGVLGASPDGSDVYVVATGVLSEGENAHKEAPVSGADNLYLLERVGESWKPVFVATLSGMDENDWHRLARGEYPLGVSAAQQTARVSPNGRWLAFMSERSLTGYDNEDVTSKAPGERLDEEVFLYDANSNKTICASCDPTGARPAGIFPQTVEDNHTIEDPLADREQAWNGRWLAGALPVSLCDRPRW